MQRERDNGDFYDNLARFAVAKMLAANGAAFEAVQQMNSLRRHIVDRGDEQSRRALLPAIEAEMAATDVSSAGTVPAPVGLPTSRPDRVSPVAPAAARARPPRIEALLVQATLIAVAFAGAARLISHEWSGVFSLTGGVAGALAAAWLILGVAARLRGWPF